MTRASQPLVSVVTPVYNGEEHLAECIESVLSQTYENWDYTIVNNCSTDESLSIAQKYAGKDSRIRVVNNDCFLDMLPNHNHALRQITPESKYCKMVFGDDWLFPTCLTEMVAIAEQNPSIGLIGSYGLGGHQVLWTGLPYPCRKVSGRDVCRGKLLGGPYVLGTPTSLLMRGDLVRKRPMFYNEQQLHGDQEACFDVLRESDFGFVHQILSYSRPRDESAGSFAKEFDSIPLGDLVIFLKYGRVNLDEGEYRRREKQILNEYHRILAKNVLRLRSKRFWEYHRATLATVGSRLHPWLLTKSVIREIARYTSRPFDAADGVLQWWRRAGKTWPGSRRTSVDEAKAGLMIRSARGDGNT